MNETKNPFIEELYNSMINGVMMDRKGTIEKIIHVVDGQDTFIEKTTPKHMLFRIKYPNGTEVLFTMEGCTPSIKRSASEHKRGSYICGGEATVIVKPHGDEKSYVGKVTNTDARMIPLFTRILPRKKPPYGNYGVDEVDGLELVNKYIKRDLSELTRLDFVHQEVTLEYGNSHSVYINTDEMFFDVDNLKLRVDDHQTRTSSNILSGRIAINVFDHVEKITHAGYLDVRSPVVDEFLYTLLYRPHEHGKNKTADVIVVTLLRYLNLWAYMWVLDFEFNKNGDKDTIAGAYDFLSEIDYSIVTINAIDTNDPKKKKSGKIH